ncbi:unnamed protein product [Pedinophyceae sp. YPF-701]|nr:unnamed protein product [Pedinophyceae sp. YPF-701]
MEVLTVCDDHLEDLSVVNLATALGRVAKLLRKGTYGGAPRAVRQSIVNSQALKDVVYALADDAENLDGRSLSSTLWALAIMRVRPLKAVQQMMEACDKDLLTSASARDLSSIIWGLGSLYAHPGPQLDDVASELAARAQADPHSIAPQACSMALWGLGRLEHDPGPALDVLIDHAVEHAARYKPQALTNIGHCLALLKRPHAAFFAAAQQQLVERAPEFAGRDASNLLASMQRLGLRPDGAAVAAALGVVGPGMSARDVGVTMQALAEVGENVHSEDLYPMLQALESCLRPGGAGANVIDLAMVVWSVAVMGLDDAKLLGMCRKLIGRIMRAVERGTEPSEQSLRCLVQAQTLFRADGREDLDLPSPLREQAIGAWMTALERDVRPLERQVADILAEEALACETRASTLDGLLVVDVAIPRDVLGAEEGNVGERGIAIEVVPEAGVDAEGALVGSVRAKLRVMEYAGWSPATLLASDWAAAAGDDAARAQLLADALAPFGVEIDVEAFAEGDEDEEDEGEDSESDVDTTDIEV